MYDLKEGMVVKYRNGASVYVYTHEWLYHVGNGQRYRTDTGKLVICDLLGGKISEGMALNFHLHWKCCKETKGYRDISDIRDLYQSWIKLNGKESLTRKTHNLVYVRDYAALNIWPDNINIPEPKHITEPPNKDDILSGWSNNSGHMLKDMPKCSDFMKKQPTKEIKMQKTMNRLNGLKLGEEKLVELRQDTSMSTTVNISLASILENNEQVKKMGLGKDSLLTSLSLRGENIEMVVSEGEVVREGNQALITSINELLTRNSES